jgi:hypothetical protein
MNASIRMLLDGAWNFLNNPLHNSLLRAPVTILLIFRLVAISYYCLILSQNIIPYVTTEWQYAMHSVSSSSLLFVNSIAGSNFGTWSKYLEWPSLGETTNFNKKLYVMNFPLIDSIILKLSCVENQNCSFKILGQLCRQDRAHNLPQSYPCLHIQETLLQNSGTSLPKSRKERRKEGRKEGRKRNWGAWC